MSWLRPRHDGEPQVSTSRSALEYEVIMTSDGFLDVLKDGYDVHHAEPASVRQWLDWAALRAVVSTQELDTWLRANRVRGDLLRNGNEHDRTLESLQGHVDRMRALTALARERIAALPVSIDDNIISLRRGDV